MDIQILTENTLKIKAKKTILAVDPNPKVVKFDADAILVMDVNSDPTRVNGSRITIEGPGEYEISGLKVTGIKSSDGIFFALSFENVNAIIAKASSLEKVPTDKIGEYQIAIINVDSDLNQSLVTAMESRIIVLYGEKAKEGAKSLGKEEAPKSSKISIAEDKLPEEMNVMLLS